MAIACEGKMVLLRLKRGVQQKFEKLIDPDAMAAFIAAEGATNVVGACRDIDEHGVWIIVPSYPRALKSGQTESLAGNYLVLWDEIEEVFVTDKSVKPSEKFALGFDPDRGSSLRSF